MTEEKSIELTEDRVPLAGIEEGVAELVEMYGGEIQKSQGNAREFTLPLRRGGGGGAIQCTIEWTADDEQAGTLVLRCDRNVDAPKTQRVFLLLAGVVGAILFMLWPFFPHETAFGTLGALGGVVAIAVYLMTLRKASGGIAADFLQRLAARQREVAAAG